jgi:hypoxanthine phosphoribosyltransferase
MSRTTRIQSEHQVSLQHAAQRFGDHEDMSEGRVLAWLSQFADDDLNLALRLIERIRYINATNIRSMSRRLFEIAREEIRRKKYKKVVFVAVGDPGSGSGVVARALRDVLRDTPYKLLSMVDLGRVRPKDLDAIVFVDDFSGTGSTLEKWWANVEALVRPTDAVVFVGLLVLNQSARARIEAFAEVVAVEELINRNVLADGNNDFTAMQKTVIRAYCKKTGAGQEYLSGFGGCGLLVAFRHGCPNNSLPVLWHEDKHWRPLFNRRAI